MSPTLRAERVAGVLLTDSSGIVDPPSANMENPSATIEITGRFVICMVYLKNSKIDISQTREISCAMLWRSTQRVSIRGSHHGRIICHPPIKNDSCAILTRLAD